MFWIGGPHIFHCWFFEMWTFLASLSLKNVTYFICGSGQIGPRQIEPMEKFCSVNWDLVHLECVRVPFIVKPKSSIIICFGPNCPAQIFEGPNLSGHNFPGPNYPGPHLPGKRQIGPLKVLGPICRVRDEGPDVVGPNLQRTYFITLMRRHISRWTKLLSNKLNHESSFWW